MFNFIDWLTLCTVTKTDKIVS
uniref:Uncharacterized protein n=1 Tax=Anguilla anguilla TaxID=7936 RepID=A0A0E9PD05_ANGAN